MLNYILIVMFSVCFSLTANAAAGINTEKGWSDSPHISRDGKRFYFMYSRYDFGPCLKSGFKILPKAEGPDRLGLHQVTINPFDESDTYMAEKNPDGTWKEPVAMGFNKGFSDCCGMDFNGGKSFVWLQGDGKTNNIVIAHQKKDGSWGAPIDVGPKINNHAPGVIQDNPYISPDGKILWFSSTRPGGKGGKDIWASFFKKGKWSDPVNLGAPFNSPGDDDQIWISPVAPEVYWNGPGGLMHCISDGATCKSSENVIIPGCNYAAEASLPDDGQTLYFGCGDLNTYRVKLMYSKKGVDGKWGAATDIDQMPSK